VENSLVKKENQTTPAMLLSLAVEQGADLDRLEKLMNLKLQWEANEARKTYFEAMTAFKAHPPEIDKNKKVSYGNTKYSHASLWNVTDKINSELSKYGLSASWTTKQTEKEITVTCRISHVLGHFEETSLTALPDNSGAKNSIQALGSTITYLQRYTILALTGLATQDQDDDGNGATVYISDKELSTITDMVNAKDVDLAKFLKYVGCESLETIPANKFNSAMAALRAKKDK
jgi:hypothetical protein